MTTARLFLAAVVCTVCGQWHGPVAFGADWPMWRCDASHSAASSEQLPDQLQLHWVREFPPVQPAWPNEPRLHFDASYEPVVLGKLLVIGSPDDGSVTACDTETGEQRWRFLAEGPVRFAPVTWKGRVCFGSDDGWVYCLDAADGSLKWRVRGAPENRPDRKHLGNARLISFWPVRGGPVLADGTLYFAAGIWPTMGVFIVALDAESGRTVWENHDLGLVEKVRIDHNEIREAGLSPQGYLAVADDTLLVPNGRSLPACLDRKTGKLLHYLQGYRNGDCRVTASGRYAFIGRGGVVEVATGREVGSRWAQAGSAAPKAFTVEKMDLFEGPIFPYNMRPGCSAWSVLAGDTAYGMHQGAFYAYDLSRAAVSEYDTQQDGRKLRPWRWDPPELWKLATPQAKSKPLSDALIKAGNRLYGHAGKSLLALELPTAGGEPKVVWQQDVEGTPSAILAADAKLFVVTKEGRLYCFAAGQATPATHARKRVELSKAADGWDKTAGEILERTQVSEGYCLILGIGTGRLCEELLVQSKLKVIGVDPNAEKVRRLHERLLEAGVYGTRAEVFTGKPCDFLFPQYLASLVVSEDVASAGLPDAMPIGRLYDVLRPYGGTLCLALPPDRREAFEKKAAAAGLENAEVSRAGEFSIVRRAGPLRASASWTHECADAARSYFSKDQRVRAPLGILWYGDGGDHGFWKHHDYGIGVKPQVIGGRVFALQLSSRTLIAYDAYTGRHLWKTQVAPFTRYASLADGIYVAGDDRCTVYDPATGRERAAFQYTAANEAGRKPIVSDIRVSDDLILIAAAFQKVRDIEKGLWDSALLVALDRKSGRQLWTRQAKQRFNNNAIAVSGGMVFCIDSVSPIETEQTKRESPAPKTLPADVFALDARTGDVRWSAVTEAPYRICRTGSWTSIQSHDDWLCCSEASGLLLTGRHGQTCAFEAAGGKQVWQQNIGGGEPLIMRGDTFIHQGGGVFDVRTGKPAGKAFDLARGGCNYAVGCEQLLLLRDSSVCYVDVNTRTKYHLRNVRSGCSNSLVAADGLLNVPGFAVGCVCNYPIQTAFAMVHMPESAEW